MQDQRSAVSGTFKGTTSPEKPELQLLPEAMEVSTACPDPTGKTLAVAGGDTVQLWDLNTGKPLRRLRYGRVASPPSWSTDRRMLAFGVSGDTAVSQLSWSSDGHSLAVGTTGGTLSILNLADNTRTETRAAAAAMQPVWSPSGEFVASRDQDEKVRVWNAATSECVQHIEPEQVAKVIGWTPDSRYLATVSKNLTVALWDPHSGACLACLPASSKDWASLPLKGTFADVEERASWLRALLASARQSETGWSPDGRYLATTDDLSVRIRYARSGRSKHHVHLPPVDWDRDDRFIYEFAWSPDGSCLAVSDHRMVRSWDPHSGAELHTFDTGSDNGCELAWSPNGRQLATGHTGGVQIWDPVSGSCSHTLHTAGSANSPYDVSKLHWSPDGRYLAAGSLVSLRIWDTVTHARLLDDSDHGLGMWLPGNRYVAINSLSGAVSVWTRSDNTGLNASVAASAQQPAAGSDVNSMAWSPDGKHLAVLGDKDGTVMIWDAMSGAHKQTFTGHGIEVLTAAWSPDGRRLATSGRVLEPGAQGTVRVWDPDSKDHQHSLTGHTGWVRAVEWSRDGKYLATGSDDKTVRIWDADTGSCLHTLTGHEWGVRALAWSPAGDRLASGGTDATMLIWDVARGVCLQQITDQSGDVLVISWSPDGRFLAVGDRPVRVRDAATGSTVHVLPRHSGWVRTLSWSPESRRLAAVIVGGRSVRIWDAFTSASQIEMTCQREVRSVHWSPDGQQLAVLHVGDHAVRILDAATGLCLRTVAGQDTPIQAVAFSPEGARIVTASPRDRLLRMWDATTGLVVADLLRFPQGWAVFYPDGRYKHQGPAEGQFWWASGLERLEPADDIPSSSLVRVDPATPLTPGSRSTAASPTADILKASM